MRRREFLKTSTAAGIGLSLGRASAAPARWAERFSGRPVVISTWRHGLAANAEALATLEGGGSALDAAQRGVMVSEADPAVTSVGYGGLPNAEGVVELDAALMDGDALEAGSVAGLRDILHPVAVARKVMDETPHVLMVGDGARRFALRRGFRKENLLTPEARRRFKRRRAGARAEAAEGHDTIGLLVLDSGGTMAAACTTSGLAWKLPGRVGDSPLVGHGLYCDSSAGAAAATGVGEEVIKVCGSYQVVEYMRQGVGAGEAVRRVLERVLRRSPANRDRQVAFVALRADGQLGFGSIRPGFQAAVATSERRELVDAPSLVIDPG